MKLISQYSQASRVFTKDLLLRICQSKVLSHLWCRRVLRHRVNLKGDWCMLGLNSSATNLSNQPPKHRCMNCLPKPNTETLCLFVAPQICKSTLIGNKRHWCIRQGLEVWNWEQTRLMRMVIVKLLEPTLKLKCLTLKKDSSLKWLEMKKSRRR